MRKLPTWVVGVIVAAAVVAALILAVSYITGSTSKQGFFRIGKDMVPSVKLVLGEERIISGMSSSTSGGVETLTYKYEVAENQNVEMQKYAEALTGDHRYINITDYSFAGPEGSGFQFAKESVEEGYIVIVQIDYDTGGYTLTITRGKGTLSPDDPGDPGQDPGDPGSGPGDPGTEPAMPTALPGLPDVFDFSALPAGDFPRGTWSANQLTGRYGPAVEIVGSYVPNYEAIWVYVTFEDFQVCFAPEGAYSFSLYEPRLDEGRYPLKSGDLDIELEIAALWVTGEGIGLPYGLKVGQSAKEGIMGIYPVGPYSEYRSDDPGYFVDLIGYQYAFPDDYPPGDEGSSLVGGIDYFFDESGILNRVIVNWRQSDL